MAQKKWLERHLKSGEAIYIGDIIVMPQCEAYLMKTPWGPVVLNRPAAVFVDQGGIVERRPIIDVTRQVQLLLLGASVLFLIAGLILSHSEGDT